MVRVDRALRVRVSAAIGLVLSTLLVGCSGPGEDPGPGGTADLPAQGPLEVMVGWAQPVEGIAGMLEQLRLRESRIAACMTELGFEYFPDVPAPDEVIESDGPAQGTREYVERYGYGVWTPVTDEAGAFQFDYEGSPEREEYLASMSPAESEAYYTAMYGPITESHPDGSWSRSGGCMAVGYDGIGDQDEYLAQVRDDAIAFLTALPEDPAFAELDARWSACMAGEGMSFASPGRAHESVYEGHDEALERAADAGIDHFTLPEVPERAAEEKRVALLDFECRESLGYDRQHTLLAHELQERYVADHREDLDLLAAAQAG